MCLKRTYGTLQRCSLNLLLISIKISSYLQHASIYIAAIRGKKSLVQNDSHDSFKVARKILEILSGTVYIVYVLNYQPDIHKL